MIAGDDNHRIAPPPMQADKIPLRSTARCRLRRSWMTHNPSCSAVWLVAALVLALLPGGCGEPGAHSAGGGPRGIVVISIDTLRADHLGAYGYERNTSPFLDRLASEGVLFEQAVSSAPWTLPSHVSLLSGLYPSTHRAVDGSEGIAPSVRMAAEIFHEAGWATGGFVASWFVSHRYGFARGFDRFEDFEQTLNNNTKQKVTARRVIDEAAGWLRRNSGGRFFLFVHLYDVHFNYDPPPEHAALFDTGYRGPRPPYKKYSHYFDNPLPADLLAQEIAMYDGAIHYVDAELERLYAVLDQLGLAGETLLVVTADHGEEFFERGSWGHAHTLYEEQVHAPLILHGPDLGPGRRVPQQVRHVDVLPTLLEVAGLPAPDGLHGTSLWDLATGEVSPAASPRPAFLETSRFGSNVIGLRRDGWKVVLDLKNGTQQLFDLGADPGETTDRASVAPGGLEALRGEALAAAGAFVPDRWLLRWFAREDAPLHGTLGTTGHFFFTRVSPGRGQVTVLPGGGQVSFELEPGGVLEMGLLPVDATLTLEEVPTCRGEPVRVVVGREARTAPDGPLTVSNREAVLLTGVPVPEAPAAALWLEQSRGSGGTVHLTEEDIRRLESLGYVMR